MSPIFAGVVELVDTGDLKSPGSDTVPVRVRSPAPHGEKRTTKHRGVEQLVARRAHNPEVGGSSPPSATKCAENIDAKNPEICAVSGFFIGFFSNRFQKKLRPDFQHGGELERIHDGFEGSVCDISSQILTFFVFSRQNVYLERRHIIMIQKSTILCYNMMK